ncbi:pantothenate transporter liz1 [Pyrenophora tritici-repentis Pt-1C-BFP]|uniref:Pantothenate transporter liz1 n=1 Tax=Pyrenophora tritici-repentis (strain Pt-1C-BFP) TaxID=426418 RepID=B2WFJ0_PYRTR|nr:pantothenate transporter liz1 [Pyrenophora tritici-repentis Pt-1C-BFP]EDU41747.1 pantothenate transporter liz1 [Pyrenophora tritici-repentis Pt-1C-BFP]
MASAMEPPPVDKASEEKMIGNEKLETSNHIHTIENLPDPDAGLSEEERAAHDKVLLHKLDWQLIPWLSFLYLISFLDRTNIGNAKVDGLQQDLQMTDGQYNASLTIFFVSYSVFEPLTNVLLKKLRPSVFLPIIMILWGICMTCMGLVHNYAGLMTARWWLGVAEAGLFPGVNYYLSCWYKRSEFGIRAAIFFSAAALAGSFGGLLAAGIAQMAGVGGKPGWAWIFILEGLVTIVVGIASYWMVHDFPAEATFLSPDDRARVLRRLRADKQASASHEDFQMKYFWQSATDWKTLMFAIIYMGADGSLYAFSLFLPSIISGMGYKSTTANLLSVPPYAVAAVVTVVVGYIADRTQQRGYCNMAVSIFGIVGFAMLIGSGSPNVQYAVTWAANNVEGVYKRGVTLGFVIGWGNINGVVSSNIYRSKDRPRYFLGHGVVLAYLSLWLLGGSIATRILLARENEKRMQGLRDAWAEGKSEQEVGEMGDRRPDFLYTL